ncbi:MAG: hypothetical protein IT435_20250 [Phycisphaerales bacterium]|nr:hypothetical protein [Phycisphaerales bacterium]
MDDRREIREGAGLEEARLNQDFIEFLRRWSTPILVVVAVIAIAYAGYMRWKERQHTQINEAYAELERVAGVPSPSPDSLQRVAEEYEKVGGVAILARLQAADVYLRSVRLGIKPGAEIDQQGAVANKEDLLTPEDRTFFLNKAQDLYSQVIQSAHTEDAQKLLAIGATYGLAAVAECRDDFDAARKHYESVIALAKDGPYATHTKIAQARIDAFEKIKQPVKVYETAQLPAAAIAPLAPWQQPTPSAASNPAATSDKPSSVGPPVDVPGATPDSAAPAPTPTPTPTSSEPAIEPNREPQPEPKPEPAPAPPAESPK